MRLRRVAVGLAVAGLLTVTGASAAWADGVNSSAEATRAPTATPAPARREVMV